MNLERYECRLVVDALSDWQPVQRAMQLCSAGRPRRATHCPGKCVLGNLQATQIPGGHAANQTVAIVEFSGNDSLGNHLGGVEMMPRSDVSQGPDVVIAAMNNGMSCCHVSLKSLKVVTCQSIYHSLNTVYADICTL